MNPSYTLIKMSSLTEHKNNWLKPLFSTVFTTTKDVIESGKPLNAITLLTWNSMENFSHKDNYYVKVTSKTCRAFDKLIMTGGGHNLLKEILQEAPLKPITNYIPSKYAESSLQKNTNHLPEAQKQFINMGFEAGKKLGAMSSSYFLPKSKLLALQNITITPFKKLMEITLKALFIEIPLYMFIIDTTQAVTGSLGSLTGKIAYRLSDLHLSKDELKLLADTSESPKCLIESVQLANLIEISTDTDYFVTPTTPTILNLSKDELKLLADTSESPKCLIESVQLANLIEVYSSYDTSNEIGADTCKLGYEEIFFHTESGNLEIA